MRLLALQEYQTSDPVALSVAERAALAALVPELRVEPAPGQENAYRLTPGAWIGTVALKDLAVEIQPKLTIERVLFLLSHSVGLAKWSDEPFRFAAPDSLIEALVRVFAWHLEQALRRGVLQGYRTEETALMAVRGRIRFDEQVRRRFGVLLPVEVRFDEFSEDILENRLLKAALASLGHLRLRAESSRASLRRFNHVLELVSEQTYDSRHVPVVQYNRLNEHYRGAVEWARLILRFSSVESRHGQVVGNSVLFDMNKVFEEFVRIGLREALRLTPREFPAGGECRPLLLDLSGKIRLQPDLSWWAGKTCRIVGDVKYKAVNVAGVKHADLYQLLAYVTAACLQSGILIYAKGEGEPAVHVIPMAGKQLHVYCLDLAGDLQDIRAQIRATAAALECLAAGNGVHAARQTFWQPTCSTERRQRAQIETPNRA